MFSKITSEHGFRFHLKEYKQKEDWTRSLFRSINELWIAFLSLHFLPKCDCPLARDDISFTEMIFKENFNGQFFSTISRFPLFGGYTVVTLNLLCHLDSNPSRCDAVTVDFFNFSIAAPNILFIYSRDHTENYWKTISL